MAFQTVFKRNFVIKSNTPVLTHNTAYSTKYNPKLAIDKILDQIPAIIMHRYC